MLVRVRAALLPAAALLASGVLAAAAPAPQRVGWYPAGHYLEDDDARRDRLDWLRGQLSLSAEG